MRKAINITAIIFFIWLVLIALDVPGILLNFLLVGALPGSSASVSPTIMLALMTTGAGIVIFELAVRHISFMRRVRQNLLLALRRKALPRRRYSRI